MEGKYILALDQGTTSSRAVLIDRAGDIVRISQKEFTQIYPQPGWVEMSPELIWTSVLEVVSAVNHQMRHDPVRALAISCHGEAVAPIDAQGKALRDFIITFDNRTVPQCEWWKTTLGNRKVFELTGMP